MPDTVPTNEPTTPSTGTRRRGRMWRAVRTMRSRLLGTVIVFGILLATLAIRTLPAPTEATDSAAAIGPTTPMNPASFTRVTDSTNAKDSTTVRAVAADTPTSSMLKTTSAAVTANHGTVTTSTRPITNGAATNAPPSARPSAPPLRAVVPSNAAAKSNGKVSGATTKMLDKKVVAKTCDALVAATEFAAAVSQCTKEAEAGKMRAQRQLGLLLLRGRGVKRDETEAAQWFSEAANAGDPESMYRFADALERGRGVKQDRDDARRWFERAAARKYEDAARRARLLAR